MFEVKQMIEQKKIDFKYGVFWIRIIKNSIIKIIIKN